MMGAVSSEAQLSGDDLVDLARATPSMNGLDLAGVVTCPEAYGWEEGLKPEWQVQVVAYDFGIKHNILRLLTEVGCRVTVVPATASAEEVLALQPDGIFLSNGPGDPAAVTYAIEETKKLIESEQPIFGICLGHQILGLALGGTTHKLKFGHRGGNQPVKDTVSTEQGGVTITSHNHGFAVSAGSLPAEVEVTHVNLNDGCIEGLRHKTRPVFSIQYHPEASPGPHDALGFFQQFVTMMAGRK
jgi:carbamoyl-phosphate synthase small subunit